MNDETAPLRFQDLKLAEPLLEALTEVGYESPSPIQAATIPPLLEGRDVLGQAQTGTGKTAAFALPILSRLERDNHTTQALVLAPTRELAIQVAEAFQRYACKMPGFHVLPIYGGQSYGPQLSALRRGAQVVVGTPGRVIDHMERGSLNLSKLRWLVLDEADEMLRMGFVEEVEKVLARLPEERQIALFSATMPSQIRRIANTYLKEPVHITIKAKTATADNIRQRYWFVSGLHKLDALTRILEAEPFEAMIVFARTKQATDELAERLRARGFAAGAINGDVEQKQRERMIQQLKDGKIDILVATDVAARGLDVERISHVLNYDIPYDAESYVHRIGRTGRAGRSGEAILFVTPRERNMLRVIERVARQSITQMNLPSIDAVNDRRMEKFMERITETIAGGDLEVFQQLIEKFEQSHNVPAIEIAAALAKLVHGDRPLLLDPRAPQVDHGLSADVGRKGRFDKNDKSARKPSTARPDRGDRPRPDRRPRVEREARSADERPRPERVKLAPGQTPFSSPDTKREAPAASRPPREEYPRATPAPPRSPREEHPRTAPAASHSPREEYPRAAPPPAREPPSKREPGMQTYRVEVGSTHGVEPRNLVGAIANEAGLESRFIGRIEIRDEHSLIDLPEGMPKDVFKHLKKVWVSGQKLGIVRAEPGDMGAERAPSARKGKKPEE